MIRSYKGKAPACAPSARVAESAVLVGDVAVADRANIWFGAVLRGDAASISVGEDTNIQDNAVIHCDPGFPAVLGKGVTVGHGAVVHGCTVEDGALIGMGAILLNGCVVGRSSLVAAGALVPQNAVIPPESLVIGSPARVLRPLRPEELADLVRDAKDYVEYAAGQLPLAGGPERSAT